MKYIYITINVFALALIGYFALSNANQKVSIQSDIQNKGLCKHYYADIGLASDNKQETVCSCNYKGCNLACNFPDDKSQYTHYIVNSWWEIKGGCMTLCSSDYERCWSWCSGANPMRKGENLLLPSATDYSIDKAPSIKISCHYKGKYTHSTLGIKRTWYKYDVCVSINGKGECRRVMHRKTSV